MNQLTLDEERTIQHELSRGESIRWAGRPNPKVIFHPSDWFAVPFSFLWGGFAIFWEFGVQKDGWTLGTLWGIPFVVIGQYLIWGRFVYAAWKKRRVLYVLTDRRAFTIVRPPQAKVISTDLDGVPAIEKQVRPDGKGTINIGAGDLRYGRRGAQTTPDDLYLGRGFPVFVDIDNADEVFTILKDLQKSARDRHIASD